MARKHAPDPPTPDPELTVSHDEASSRITERIEKGKAIADRQFRSIGEIKAARNEFNKWSDYNKDLLRRLFTTAKMADEYSPQGGMTVIQMNEPSVQEQIDGLRDDLARKIHRLESIKDRLELIPLATRVQGITTSNPQEHTNRAFVVHGHDEAIRETVARFLEQLGIEAIILNEQANSGQTLIEKLEYYSNVDFAVVLLTPDDVGAEKGSIHDLRPRARQNVIMELGYFVGKLKRSHVCALYQSSVELPTDYVGVGYIPLDDGDGWRLRLVKELRAGGFTIDMNLL